MLQINELHGILTIKEKLHGLLIPTNEYTGKYEVTPKAFESQTLNTADKLLKENIVVLEVPYYEVSNEQNGTTVYIAKEV